MKWINECCFYNLNKVRPVSQTPSNLSDDLHRGYMSDEGAVAAGVHTRWLWAMSKPISDAVSEDELIISKSCHFRPSVSVRELHQLMCSVLYVWLDAHGCQTPSIKTRVEGGRCQPASIFWSLTWLHWEGKKWPRQLINNSMLDQTLNNIM